ncbi:hypothetical protein NL108_007791, partial [Boleophthalmus pectinirostris]
GNKNAKRKMRRVELGWMNFNEFEERYKQVKSINGGGTRSLTISVKQTMEDIKVLAENLFFPNGLSKKKQCLSHYSTNIESSQIHLEMSNTIEEAYNKSKVKILRLYLCTKKKGSRDTEAETDEPSVVDLMDNQDSTSNDEMNAGTSADDLEIDTLDDTLLWDGTATAEGTVADSPITVNVSYAPDMSADISEPEALTPERQSDVPHPGVDLPQSALLSTEFDAPSHNITGILPPSSSPVRLIVRRGQCLTDLIRAFKNPDIMSSEVTIIMRLPNGMLEQGEGVGVLRDCLTEFWNDFYESCTLGVDVKVPFIKHDFQCEKWLAVARVLVVGWRQTGYFPVKLATPFLEEVMYGSTTSSLKDFLLLYVSHEEKNVLLKALDDIQTVDFEDLLDVLDALECKQVPTKDTLMPILSQIGHKLIIQAPMYVIKCWRPVVSAIANMLPQEGLHSFLAKKTPTAKAVKDLLDFPEEMTAMQLTVSRYLKKYIGETDLTTLQLFLRFCTGSDLVDEAIHVEFIETTDFLRRPQSHTCGCILKLPIGYHSYPDFRSEFNNILTSSLWVMDII